MVGRCEGKMKPVSNSVVSWPVRFAPLVTLIEKKQIAKTPGSGSIPRSALALVALAAGAVSVYAQQPYGYGYAAPQYGSAQPQYQQPQYQPQYQQQPYQQPQYERPQYQQRPPQYAPQPQYAQPADPNNPQSYADSGIPDLTQPDPGAPTQQSQQPLSAGDLEQLLAPIALYPDNLLAQVLAAATYPAQVAAADQWVSSMRAQGYGSQDQVAAGAQAQTDWDPSVKALTAFPDVLNSMSQNLQWTTALGNAYYNQPQDVMQTVQVLRERAEQAGNLETTPQEDVTDDQGYIEVRPADPEVVYVPAYNPWYVYGEPLEPYPGFAVWGVYGSGYGGWPIRFGAGVALGAFERMPFGWMGWGMNWRSRTIWYNRGAYCTRSTSVADWGFAHGGQRVFGYRGGANHGLPGNGFRTPQPVNRFGNSFDSARGGAYGRPVYGVGRSDGYGRGFGNTRPENPGQMNYNRMPEPRTYAGGNGYGYGGANRPSQSYGGRPGMGYTTPQPVYRAPSLPSQPYRGPAYRAPEFGSSLSPRYSGHGFSNRGNEGFGQPLPRNEHSSGGFHFFGGGHASNGFEGGRAPQGFGGGHDSFSGGGHSFSGFGHGGGFSHGGGAPKESHSGGGGHGHWR